MEREIFGTLSVLREKPIPDQAGARARYAGYRGLLIARASRYGNEPLAELSGFGIAGENYYHTARNPPYWRRIDGATPHLLARVSVAEKLRAVNRRLDPAGIELFVFDAWRPRAVQAYFHDVWMPGELKKRDPSLTGAALAKAVERYWAAPTSAPSSPAPHATGAALDLTLRWKGSDALWMGSIFDDATEIAHRDYFERPGEGALRFSDEEARANRRLLHWLMHDEGFAGHPNEWWHYSWGDQLWAALTGGTAHYGLAKSE